MLSGPTLRREPYSFDRSRTSRGAVVLSASPAPGPRPLLASPRGSAMIGSDQYSVNERQPLGWRFYLLWQRLSDWRRSRDLALLLRGLPALLLILITAVLAAVATGTPDTSLIGRYQQQAARAFHNEDFSGARTCYERLLSLRDDHPDNEFQLAMTLVALGQHDHARAI